jgi:hypothetical protein
MRVTLRRLKQGFLNRLKRNIIFVVVRRRIEILIGVNPSRKEA